MNYYFWCCICCWTAFFLIWSSLEWRVKIKFDIKKTKEQVSYSATVVFTQLNDHFQAAAPFLFGSCKMKKCFWQFFFTNYRNKMTTESVMCKKWEQWSLITYVGSTSMLLQRVCGLQQGLFGLVGVQVPLSPWVIAELSQTCRKHINTATLRLK